MSENVRWAILGTANIARQSFIPAVEKTSTGSIVAVASRDLDQANRFAQQEGIAAGYAGYEKVLEREDIDAVYVALPNHLHAQWTMAAMRAGKHVLCEKPLAMNPRETAEVLQVAEQQGRLLWEAFAFRFRSEYQLLCEWISSGRIGDLRHIQSSFYSTISNPHDIRWNKAFGGGALLDVGCYPIDLAHQWFHNPKAMQSMMVLRGDVDIEVQAQVAYGQDGQVLQFLAGLNRPYETTTRLLGTRGRIDVTNPFHPSPQDRLVLLNSEETQVHTVQEDELSFLPMMRHIHEAILGRKAPSWVAGERTLNTARVMEGLSKTATIIA